MHTVFSLTVSESKRLIARGVAQADFVRRAMEEGILAVGSGTTNGYIVEEITGEAIDKHAFVTGHTVPRGYSGPALSYSRPDLVIRKGERLDLPAVDALAEMGPGDVLVKVGDQVFHSKYGGTNIKIEGEEYIILREDDILAIAP